MPPVKILVIDDDEAVCVSLDLLLRKAGYLGLTAHNPEDGLEQVLKQEPGAVILDMNFSMDTSGQEGLELLRQIRRKRPHLPVILITAWGSIPLAVEGMKAGASDFINKPWNNEHLLRSLQTALKLTPVTDQSPKVLSRQQLNRDYNFEKLIGETPAFLQILETIGKVSATDASVLLCGESGTGKELIAEALHNNSPRRNCPFIKVNLNAIPATLFESEMFGHKRGAFTDAKADRIGRFQLAHKGSIFLDEIGDLSLANQVKMLRVLQEQSFEPLGSTQTLRVNVRVISATNKKLHERIAQGAFREDLYYRINLITIQLPALRERADDIPLLVRHFIGNIKTIYQREELSVTTRALKWLKDLPWQGNIRELKNLVERTVLITQKDVLDQEDFNDQLQGTALRGSSSHLPPVGSMTIEEMEEKMIRKALDFHARNISKVAKSLGLSRAALYRRLEKYGIPV